jgi:hypothetical protein
MENHITKILYVSDDGPVPRTSKTEHSHKNTCYTILGSSMLETTDYDIASFPHFYAVEVN